MHLLQVWHSVSREKTPLRKQYLETILPPFVAVLRRWRPLLAGIHELATGDGLNPLVVDDRALAADSLPIEVVNLSCICELSRNAVFSYYISSAYN